MNKRVSYELQQFTSNDLNMTGPILKIAKINQSLIHEAESFFSENYKLQLKKHINYNQKLCSRFIISKIFKDILNNECNEPSYDKTGKPLPFKNHFRSTSHSENTILIWIHKTPISVDIESKKIRDKIIFRHFNQEIRHKEDYKNRDGFYRLRTMWECLNKHWLRDFWNNFIKKEKSSLLHNLLFNFQRNDTTRKLIGYSGENKDHSYSILIG